MSATIVAGAPSGVIRVFTPGRPVEMSSELKREARTAAQREHGSVTVGANPVPVPAKLKGVAGLGWDYTPVTTSRKAAPVVPAAPRDLSTTAGPVGRKVVGMLAASLGLTTEEAETLIRDIARSHVTPAPAAKVAKVRKAPAKEAPAFLGAAARKAAATCKTCDDYGVVRKAGKRAGGAYKTAKGATDATASGWAVPCPTHVGGKAGKAARKAAKLSA